MFESEKLRKGISEQFNNALLGMLEETENVKTEMKKHGIRQDDSYIDEIIRVANLRKIINFEGLVTQQTKALEEKTRPLHEIALMPGQSIIDTLFAQTPFDVFLGMDGNVLVMGEEQPFWLRICERNWLECQQTVKFLIDFALAVEDVVRELGDGS